MAKIEIKYEINVKGAKEMKKTIDNIENVFIKDMYGTKNKEVMNLLRQKLSALYPGAMVKSRTMGNDFKVEVSNLGQLNKVSVDRLVMEAVKEVGKIEEKEFLKVKEK